MRWRPLISLLALVLAVILPVRAEDIYHQVYLSEAQALRVIFAAGVTVESRQVAPTPAQKRMIERHLGRRLSEGPVTFYIGRKGQSVDGYALIIEEIGKVEPITFVVGMNGDGTVRDVAVMVFRERRGDGVRRRRFLAQFPGRNTDDKLVLNRDILPLTGSTLSSVAVAAGVKRALVLTRVLMLGKPL